MIKQKAGMVDITAKKITERKAVASAEILMSPEAYQALTADRSPKGNVWETAKVAGIMAAKSTAQIIPLCHPLELTKLNISYQCDPKAGKVTITSEVTCLGRTGVEMEALVAASTAALTIYDMMKWADKAMIIAQLKLLHKSGGKSGDYQRLSPKVV